MAVNKSYVYGKGLLKLVLLVTSCIAFACMMVADDKVHYLSDDYQSRYDFFLFAHITGAGSSLLIYILFLLNVNGSCGSKKCWAFLVFIISLGLAVACVVVSGLLVEYAKNEQESFLYQISDNWKWMADHRVVAVAAGFCSSLFFFIDAVLHIQECRGL